MEDPELGRLRYCRSCEEWWPYDSEFYWYPEEGRTSICKACHRRHGRRWSAAARARLRSIEHAPRACGRCLTVLTQNRECHGCAGRTVGPLTVSMLERAGLAPRQEVAA